MNTIESYHQKPNQELNYKAEIDLSSLTLPYNPNRHSRLFQHDLPTDPSHKIVLKVDSDSSFTYLIRADQRYVAAQLEQSLTAEHKGGIDGVPRAIHDAYQEFTIGFK